MLCRPMSVKESSYLDFCFEAFNARPNRDCFSFSVTLLLLQMFYGRPITILVLTRGNHSN